MFLFNAPSIGQLGLALAALRVTVGTVFIAHGAQKLFVYGFAGVTNGFAQMGVPFPGVVGPFIGLLELFGGIALIAGLLTRLVSLGLGFTMLGAIFLVHFSAGFFMPAGYEFAFTLLGSTIALVLAGAGEFSIDGILARRNRATASEINRGTTLRAA